MKCTLCNGQKHNCRLCHGSGQISKEQFTNWERKMIEDLREIRRQQREYDAIKTTSSERDEFIRSGKFRQLLADSETVSK